jgi:hypothetical protein
VIVDTQLTAHAASYGAVHRTCDPITFGKILTTLVITYDQLGTATVRRL